jgi:hypothetical protein
MGSVHARGDTFLTFGLKALTETNTSRLATGRYAIRAGFNQYFGGEEGIIITLPDSCIDMDDLLGNDQLYTIVNSRVLLTDDSRYAEVPSYHGMP